MLSAAASASAAAGAGAGGSGGSLRLLLLLAGGLVVVLGVGGSVGLYLTREPKVG